MPLPISRFGIHRTFGARMVVMQRSTLFAIKLLLPCWLVLQNINPDPRVYSQEKIRIGILSAYSRSDRATATGMYEGDSSDQVKERILWHKPARRYGVS